MVLDLFASDCFEWNLNQFQRVLIKNAALSVWKYYEQDFY